MFISVRNLVGDVYAGLAVNTFHRQGANYSISNGLCISSQLCILVVRTMVYEDLLGLKLWAVIGDWIVRLCGRLMSCNSDTWLRLAPTS